MWSENRTGTWQPSHPDKHQQREVSCHDRHLTWPVGWDRKQQEIRDRTKKTTCLHFPATKLGKRHFGNTWRQGEWTGLELLSLCHDYHFNFPEFPAPHSGEARQGNHRIRVSAGLTPPNTSLIHRPQQPSSIWGVNVVQEMGHLFRHHEGVL